MTARMESEHTKGKASCRPIQEELNDNPYDSRIYLYEPSLPHAIVFPMLYGEGMRFVVLAQTKLANNLHLVSKMAITKYFDREVIGTGLQQIKNSSQTNVDLLLRWCF